MKYSAGSLTQKDFAPYGQVVEHSGDHRRHRLSIGFDEQLAGIRQAFWVSKLELETTMPNRIEQMERHPYSDQAFVPLGGGTFLVVVCPSDAEGNPDVKACEAFVAGPSQGVIYRRNVWHAPLAALSAPAEFFVTMGLAEGADNDEFRTLPTPIEIDLPKDPR